MIFIIHSPRLTMSREKPAPVYFFSIYTFLKGKRSKFWWWQILKFGKIAALAISSSVLILHSGEDYEDDVGD